MKIDELNAVNLAKYLDGYPQNMKIVFRTLYLVMQGMCFTHIVKYYKTGYIGVSDALQREEVLKQCPFDEILRKYYPDLGNVNMTFSVNDDTGRISPMFYDCDTEEYHSFNDKMMANTAMWDEMANVKLSLPTIEYAEEKPLDEQYEEWKRCNDKSNNYYAEYLAEKEKNRLLKDKGTYTYKLSMAALIVSFVALIINLIIA